MDRGYKIEDIYPRFGKIFLMRKRNIIIGIIVVSLIAFLLYQIPSIKTRVDWGLFVTSAYIRGIVKPIGEMPTPIPVGSPAPVEETTTTTPLPPCPPPAEPTAVPPPTPTALPPSVKLPAPQWEKQDINNCGPATLAMYLRYYGWEGDQFDVADVIKPKPQDRNVNIDELAYFSRNYAGWLVTQYRVAGDIELLKTFVANGIPVMIEEGDDLEREWYANDDKWAGHFLLMTGYDESRQIFYAQDSFRQQDREVTYANTDARWKTFNRVYILIYLPQQEDTVKLILGPQWDVDGNRQYALDVAQAEIDADPQDAFAWFNLGSNLVYFERYAEAADVYDEARRIGLPQRMFRYQFGPFLAYYHSLRTDDLMALVDYALDITPNSEEAWLWRGWGLVRQGDQAGAIKAFRRSYQENVTSFDAKWALDYLGVTP
jgi:tetratricopeptide (TPR) repeat protein